MNKQLVFGRPGQDNSHKYGAFNIGISLSELSGYLGMSKKKLIQFFITMYTGCVVDKKYLKEFDRVLAIKISKFHRINFGILIFRARN